MIPTRCIAQASSGLLDVQGMSIAIATNLKLPLAVVRASPGPTTNQLKAKPYRRANSRISATSWHGFGVPEEPEPTWVQTHRGVPNLSTDKPDKPCKVCLGKGKVACGSCDGIGTHQIKSNRSL